MPRPKDSLSDQLHLAQSVIANTLADAVIQARAAQYGYTVDKLQEGKALYDHTIALSNAQTAAEGAYQLASAQFKAADKLARDTYQALAQVARAAFAKNRAQLTALGLSGPMPRTIAGFSTAAKQLFDNALGIAEIQAVLATFGYDDDQLQSERAKIVAYDDANLALEAAKGTAQQATQARDGALQALNDWVATYIKIVRVALRDQKQLLEKLGLIARTTPTAAQKAKAKQKTAKAKEA
jgi:hypothetical protein